MRLTTRSLVLLIIVNLLALPAHAEEVVDLSGFEDAIKHWQDQNQKDTANYYSPTDVKAIAENILLYQRNNGGWPVNKNPLRQLTAAELKATIAQKNDDDTSLDNRNTYPQIRYLAEAYQIIPDERYKLAAIRGLRFLISAQLANGGWTHSPPNTDKYYGHITIMDDVMTGTLRLLRDINQGAPAFDFLPAQLKQQIVQAQKKGDALLLKLQVKINDQPTGWAGQYHREQLTPITGRSFELPGVVSRESVAVVEYLLEQPHPNIETIAAIEAAIKWFKTAAIANTRVEKTPIQTVDYKFHSADYDWLVTEDATAPPIWARFYHLTTGEPFFANRDGNKVLSLNEVEHERRTGYAWYGYWPEKLLRIKYPEWKKRLMQKGQIK